MADSRRGGYDRAWQKARAAQLMREARCRCGSPAREVHHRIPLYKGGARLDPANLESLCPDCHRAETGTQLAERNEEGTMRYRRTTRSDRQGGPPKVWLGQAFDDFPVLGPALVIHHDGRTRFVPAGRRE
jgi:hypothetical protein